MLTQEQIDDQQAAVRRFLDGLLDAFGLDAGVEVGISEDEAIEARRSRGGPRPADRPARRRRSRPCRSWPAGRSSSTPRTRCGCASTSGATASAGARRWPASPRRWRPRWSASGEAASLEPMNAADRKVVHDTVNDIEGVRTSSEGEEPRRRVVISAE